MENFTFKGYTYTVTKISGKTEFDNIYQKLLSKANKGRSIVKDLDTAYRISPSEVYLIRFDQERRALVPVRVLKEAVDGFLIKNRYDNKDKRLQMGIGNEMSRQSSDIYTTFEKKHKIQDESKRKLDKKRKEKEKQFQVTGSDVVKKIGFHASACDSIRSILEGQDIAYRENRDYKMKIDSNFQKIKDLTMEVETQLTDVERDAELHLHRITHLVPDDIDKEDPPYGLMGLLQQYLFLSVFNGEIEKLWVTLRDYTLKLEDLPVSVAGIIENVFTVIANTNKLVISIDRILFPMKYGSIRENDIQYKMQLFSQAIIEIFTEREGDKE